ncbi:MAG: pseudouridine synthase [Desulfuromonadaceae bacterium]|nr:pseudouridine synthase [Desulfuromonadaceae bacterium]
MSNTQERERIQKLIARAGLASRREAERWIEQGRVKVNGKVAILGDKADITYDRIEVNGHPLGGEERKCYVMLNKPIGYVTTAHDPQGRATVLDLVEQIPERLFPIGRLDLNTEGLLLLTNDGALANALLHPRYTIPKTYQVKISGELDPKTCRKLEQGVELEDGITAPAQVSKIRKSRRNTWFNLTITEGRNRQVRRMCEAQGCAVSMLKRIRFGNLDLGDLPVGKFRHLSAAEVETLQQTR